MADRTISRSLEKLDTKAAPIMTYFTTGIGASLQMLFEQRLLCNDL
jgi:hypothetical protein